MPKLAALVSLYSSGHWVENRLTNLLRSSVASDMEIWCYNAASPDPRDLDITKDYASRHPNIKLIDGEKIGVYAAWNVLIKASNSEYITNANSDDIVAPNCYEQLIQMLDTGADFAYPSWYVTAKDNQQWPPTECDIGRPGHYAGNLDVAGVGHFPMWRRSLHSKLGYFDERFQALGDAEWWARCFYTGKASFRWLDLPLACYLWRNGQNLWSRAINEVEWGMYSTAVHGYRNQ